jgi:RNase P/RNase MRP subunit POP5
MDALWNQVVELYGEYGASRAGLVLIDHGEERCFVIIRVALQALDMVKTALASIVAMDSKPVTVHVLAVSGTIKSLRKKANK